MTAPDLPLQVPRAIERLRRALAPGRVVLFGSFAQRTNHVGSDIDLLVVADRHSIRDTGSR